MLVIHNVLNDSEIQDLLNGITEAEHPKIENSHISFINKESKGWQVICDLNKTFLTKSIVPYQGDATQRDSIPSVYHIIAKRIADILDLANTNTFCQYIFLGKNGRVAPHYDAGMPGYVTYKCNIYLEGPDDYLIVGKERSLIKKGDLYCFEANLYKHWMEASNVERTHLSYGYILPYSHFGIDSRNPRVRLSNRVWERFQKDSKLTSL
jgi:hypothetical protein